MTLVVVPQINNNDLCVHTAHNAQANVIRDVVNGNLDDTNIASISGTKISDGTVTSAKLADGSVTNDKLATGAIRLGVTNVTTIVSYTTTPTVIASITVSVPAGGRDVELEIIYPQLLSTVAGDRTKINFQEGSTILQTFYCHVSPYVGGSGTGSTFKTVVTAPSAGSHTYNVIGVRDIGTGLVQWYADNLGATIKLIAKAL